MKSKDVLARIRDEAMNIAVYLLNRFPTNSINGKTSTRYGTATNFMLVILACLIVLRPWMWWSTQLAKLYYDTSLIFLVFRPKSVTYCVYDPIHNRVHITCDVMFNVSAQWDSMKQGDATKGGNSVVNNEFTIKHIIYLASEVTANIAAMRTSTTNCTLLLPQQKLRH